MGEKAWTICHCITQIVFTGIMNRKQLIRLLVILLTVRLCAIAGAAAMLPTRVVIQAEYSGWSSSSTNLTLTLTNGLYAAGVYTVAPPLVSNLMAVAKRPWPKPGTNDWLFKIDPANLGLNAAWAKANYPRLLESYCGESERGVFPNASERQRAWLTNALTDFDLLGEAVRQSFTGGWTDDSPSLELRFENDSGKTVEQQLRLYTRAQHSFMLPWEVYEGTNAWASGNADISRAVVQVLPPGFMHRDRLNGDIFRMVSGGFTGLEKVQEFIEKSTVQESLGDEAERLLQSFELQNCRTMTSGNNRFPGMFVGSLHRTNWPERLTMPIQAQIERGILPNLKAIMESAETRVAPLLKQEWLMSRLKGSGNVSVAVKAEGSPDHQWLRGHMDNVGRAAFYDRIQPALRRSQGFVIWEGFRRSSEWAILDDGRLLLYGFTGNGVLDWKPVDLGFQGEPRMLQSMSINFVGVYVDAEGTITEVVPPERK
jgi:hypothetical protein